MLASFNSHLRNVPVGDIDSAIVRSMYIKLSSEGLSQSSVAKMAVVLKQFLRQAANDDIIVRSPCDRVEALKQ